MSKIFKAVATIIAGTIGVGFLILPYAMHRFGTIGGLLAFVAVAFIILVTNLTFADIITHDKGNRQIPGYAKKYLGSWAGWIITIIILIGNLGVLLAYSIIAGNTLRIFFSTFGIYFSSEFYSLLFMVFAFVVLQYGMDIISKVSSWAISLLGCVLLLVLAIAFTKVDFSNITNIDFRYFPLFFGSSIFAFYSTTSIPVIDEIVGYDRKKYNKAIIISLLLTFIIYLLFSVILSLAYGDLLKSDLVTSQPFSNTILSLPLSFVVFLSASTSFILVANNCKEIFEYDYHIPKRTSLIIILTIILWGVILRISSFESLISLVGRWALSAQSLIIFLIWFKLKRSMLLRIIVTISGIILFVGMFL
jgi:amino acid permease